MNDIKVRREIDTLRERLRDLHARMRRQARRERMLQVGSGEN